MQMMCRLERTLLHRVKLDSLHLDLQDGRNPGDRAKLFCLTVLDTDLLSIESSIDGGIDISRTTSYINFDVAPSFILGPCAF